MSKWVVVPSTIGPEVQEIDINALGELQFERMYPHRFASREEAIMHATDLNVSWLDAQKANQGQRFDAWYADARGKAERLSRSAKPAYVLQSLRVNAPDVQLPKSSSAGKTGASGD